MTNKIKCITRTAQTERLNKELIIVSIKDDAKW